MKCKRSTLKKIRNNLIVIIIISFCNKMWSQMNANIIFGYTSLKYTLPFLYCNRFFFLIYSELRQWNSNLSCSEVHLYAMSQRCNFHTGLFLLILFATFRFSSPPSFFCSCIFHFVPRNACCVSCFVAETKD